MENTEWAIPHRPARQRRGLRSGVRQLVLLGVRILLTVLIGIPAVAGALVCSGCAVLLRAVRDIGSEGFE
jgi:hypothetical protein